MSLLGNFPHRCSIYSISRAKDTRGGSRDTSTLVTSGIECWEQQASNSEMQMFEKRGISDVRKLYFIADPGVTERNEIAVTHRRVAGTLTAIVSPIRYEVVSEATPDASAGLGVVWRVMVRDLSGRNQ